MKEDCAIIVLAAGKGSRMQSEQAKVLHQTYGKSMIQHVLTAAAELEPQICSIVVGHQAESVITDIKAGEQAKAYSLNKIEFTEQKEQLGTGDAVKSALPALTDFTGSIVILYGDVPLITGSLLAGLLENHREQKNSLSILTLNNNNNFYGRIVRGEDGSIRKIVEYKDCNEQQKTISETNSGIYVVDSAFLRPAIEQLKNDNAQSEYYLTDIVEAAVSEGQTVGTYQVNDLTLVQGVNNQQELAKAEQSFLKRKINELTQQGVRFILPETSFIAPTVEVQSGVQIGPNTQILGNSKIGAETTIEGNCFIVDSRIGQSSLIKIGCRIEQAICGDGLNAGPHANLRPGTVLGKNVKVGNFVELKKVELADGVKVNHLSYLGDCSVAAETNIGAGTVTCNYDGTNKHRTTIGKNVFIGSNSSLVAPVEIADNATIGAGSVITKNVAADSLALTRAKTTTKFNYLRKK